MASFLTLWRVPELQKLQASIQGDYDGARDRGPQGAGSRRERAAAARDAQSGIAHTRPAARRRVLSERVVSGRRHAGQKSVPCWASRTERRVSLNLLLALPIDLLEAPLDESYLDPEQRSRLRETISDLLLLWDLVRPDEAKD